MQFVIYLLLYPLLWLISMLPFPLLYAFSDIVYVIIYHIIGYRKKVVRDNLALALPHLSEEERLVIEKKFFHHLCDIFLEMIKTMTISEKEIDKRYIFTNLELYKELEDKKKSVALMCGHYASYEWAVSMNRHISFEGYGIYKKLGNPHFDKLVKKIRNRFKATLITTRETIPTIKKNAISGHLGAYGFASDQSPMVSSAYHWNSFMGIEVPVHTGAEMLAKRFDMNVVFLRTKKVKRGYYEGTFDLLSLDAKAVPNYEITDEFLKLIEKQIYEAPEFYLWTHKRWKHRRKKEEAIL